MPASIWSRPWFIALLYIAATVSVLALCAGTYLNALKGVPPDTDFTLFYASAKAWLEGGSLYQSFFYTPALNTVVLAGTSATSEMSKNLNPPVTVFLFALFAWLDLRSAYYVMCFAQFTAALLVLWKLLEHCFDTHKALRPAAALIMASYFPVMANMLLGQVGLLLFILIAMGSMALERDRQRQAGLWLGTALLLKLFIGLVFVWLLLTKRWQALLWGSAVYAVGMLLALLVFGVENHYDWLKAIHAHTGTALTWNVSLEGVYARYLGASAAASYYTMPVLANVLRALTWSAALLMLIWSAQQKGGFATGFALTLPLMLLLAPLGWIYYFPLLFISAILLWRETRSLHIRAGIALATLLSAIPQLLGGSDYYWPTLWKMYHQGGYTTFINGQQQTIYEGVRHWIQLPELHTLALLLFSALSLRVIYSLRSTHTGA